MKSAIASVCASGFLLAACASSGPTQPDASLHHHWVLSSIDGATVNPDIGSEISFGDDSRISGQAGCNRFFGKAVVRDHKLEADHLGVTMMACAPPAQVVERAVLDTLNAGATINIQHQQLALTGDQHKLVYHRAD